MNDKRRELLTKAALHLDQASAFVVRARDDEQDALDSMPENLEWSDRYEKMETAVEKLDEALDLIGDASERIAEARV